MIYINISININKEAHRYFIYAIIYYFWFYFVIKYSKLRPVSNPEIQNDLLIKYIIVDLLIYVIPAVIAFKMDNSKRYLKRSDYPFIEILLLIIYISTSLVYCNFENIFNYYDFFRTLLIIGLFEEYIFRGFIYSNLKGYNKRLAIIYSGFFFGAIHSIAPGVLNNLSLIKIMFDSSSYVLGYTIVGLVFIKLMEKSNSIIIPILIHAIYDINGILEAVPIYIFSIFVIPCYIFLDKN